MNVCLIQLVGLAMLAADPPQANTPPAAASSVAVQAAVPGPCQGCAPCTACTPTKTICVPEQYVKKNPKTVYACRCEPLCLPRLHCWFSHSDCDTCDCGPQLTRRYLVKKTRPCDEVKTKCVPKEVPCCVACPCPETCGTSLSPVPGAPAPGAVTAPVPPTSTTTTAPTTVQPAK
jgi:hypothetical protein